jgi:hypothetical protein
MASVLAMVWLDVLYPPLPVMIPTTDMYEVHADFDTFWHSAVALWQGNDIYTTPAKLTNLNPPLLTVLLAPFAWLDALTAYRVWVGLSVLMVVGSLLVVARELRLRAVPVVFVVAAVLASSPLHGALVLGQIYPVLLVGLAAGWVAERRGHPVLAAVLFGITVSLKPSLAPVLLLYAAQRRWAPLRAGVVSAVVASLVGVAVCGPASGLEWLRIAFNSPVPDTPAPGRPGGHGGVGGARRGAAAVADRLAQLPDVAVARGARADRARAHGHRHRDVRGRGDPRGVERGRGARGRHGALALLRDPARLLGRLVAVGAARSFVVGGVAGRVLDGLRRLVDGLSPPVVGGRDAHGGLVGGALPREVPARRNRDGGFFGGRRGGLRVGAGLEVVLRRVSRVGARRAGGSVDECGGRRVGRCAGR